MNQQRERVINAPWPVVSLIVILLLGFAVQTHFGVDAVSMAGGFKPSDLAQGRYFTLVSAVFLHGSWSHVLGNAAFALAFASPVAKRLGHDGLGGAVFFVFFLTCGVLANLGYALVSPQAVNPVVGASGAIAGMVGAASRLMGEGPEDLAPFSSRPVVGMALAWIIGNVLFGVLLVGWAPLAGGAAIAWQVHIVGYAVGLFLFGPLLWLMRR